MPSIRKLPTTNTSKNDNQKLKENRIRSCDYAQWDKYDADTELTKIDLSAERNRDATEVSEKQKAKLYRNLDEAVSNAKNELIDTVARMSPYEREKSANNFRIQGNELFKAGEFEEAVLEYTRSLAVMRTSVAFSNRAMACK